MNAGFLPTSTIFGASMQMEQSMVGNVLSSCADRPPIVGDFYQVGVDLHVGEVEGRTDTCDSSTDHHHASRDRHVEHLQGWP